MRSSKGKERGRRKTSSRTYALQASPFFRLERKQDLAKLLNLSPAKMARLLADRGQLYSVRNEMIAGKVRQLTVPLKGLRRCHERIFQLLRRIELPEYIRCPRRKSTAWGNAIQHAASKSVTSFDIKAFYPSTTEEHVFRFCRYRLQMSDDCARILALLCTYQGHLPLGSPMSPHLASLVHLDLFDEASTIATVSKNQLSVWVDDVTISGSGPRRDILGSIKKRAEGKGLAIHKMQRGGGKRGVELTGTFLRNHLIAPANSSHLRMKEVSERLSRESEPAVQHHLLNKLLAMARHQRTMVRQSGVRTERLDSRIAYYKRRMRDLSQSLSTTLPTKPLLDAPHEAPPFD